MTSSSSDVAADGTRAPAIAKFSLWPLPELAGRAGAEAADAEPVGPDPVQEALARGHERGRAEAMDEANRTLKRAAGRSTRHGSAWCASSRTASTCSPWRSRGSWCSGR